MPRIKARADHVTVKHLAYLLATNRDVLRRYARFIEDTPDYILNRLIETTLATDREFLTWRTAHPNDTWQDPHPRGRRRQMEASES